MNRLSHQQLKRLFFLIILCIGLNSCASIETIPLPPEPIKTPLPKTSATHTIAPGETLWRLSQMYDVPVGTIMRANELTSKDDVHLGQTLTIPGASKIKPVISLFPSRKWKYIIIHHSATTEGNSLSFNKSHLDKGWDQGVGYNFVIDNGKSGKEDGQIEVTPRWLKQEDGAHCKASNMNTKAIGICLVGNFNEEKVSHKQLDSLAYLVNKLRKYYLIPMRNILGHRDVPESSTLCPGDKFPWPKFKEKLRNL